MLNAIIIYILMAILQCIIATSTFAEIPCNSLTNKIYKCQDGSCISRENFCDGNITCRDESDEYTNATAMDDIVCQFRRQELIEKECVLPNEYKCDHEIDCVDGRDECGCDHTFKCDDGGCVLKVSFCDNLPPILGCLDGTDEREYDRTTRKGFQCPVTRTHVTKVCVLPDQYVCDGDSDCDFGIDECFCNFTEGKKKGTPLNDVYSNDNCFRCLDGTLVIPNIHVCDGTVHCEDLSDECICPEVRGYVRPAICKSICDGEDCDCPGQVECVKKVQNITGENVTKEKICLDHTAICDDLYDCQDQLDETFCPDDNQTFPCWDGKKKIKNYEVCNGPYDCDDGSDELYCHEMHNHFCSMYRDFFDVEDWSNVTKDQVVIPENITLEFDRPFFTHACDGIPYCGGLDDECGNNCSTEPEYCKYVTNGFRCPNSGSIILGVEICDEKPTCNDTFPELSVDEFGCPGRFYCHDKGKNRLPIHIPIEGKCNGKQECDDNSDELNCSSETHFYCEDGGSTLFVPMGQVCDGRADCKEGRDECQNCNPSPFSSDEKLISSRVLIIFLWIIGSLAVLGNIATIIYQIVNLIKPTGTPSVVSVSNRILVLNLSAADLLVGIYLVGLGVKDATVSEYCVLDQEWRTSSACGALGVLALIGTETSVFILLIMTAYRLYLVVRPFQSQRLLVIGLSVALAWLIAFILAFAPLASSAQDYFVSCVWFRTHFFIGRICRSDLQKFTEDLILLGGANQSFSNSIKSGGYTWSNMFAAMQHLNSSYVPERYFGYYSAHSVCLPRLFPDPQTDRDWGYSLFVILINFFAFVFILISYIFIYRRTTNNSIRKTHSEDRATALQRKVTRIVLTDFCCWMPICIMAFIRVAEVAIPDVAYAVTAIILLPINSAMNPFLYSDILDIIWERMLPIRLWCGRTYCGQQVEKKIDMISRKDKSSRKKTNAAHSSYETHSTASPSGQSPVHITYAPYTTDSILANGVGKGLESSIDEMKKEPGNGLLKKSSDEYDTQL